MLAVAHPTAHIGAYQTQLHHMHNQSDGYSEQASYSQSHYASVPQIQPVQQQQQPSQPLQEQQQQSLPQLPVVQQLPHHPTSYVSLTTQHVGIGPDGGRTPMLARVSICDYNGGVVFDSFVLPTHPVVDYRHDLTGLAPEHLQAGLPFTEVQERVAGILRGRIVVGHQLWFDFAVLNIAHLAIDTRDTGLFLPFRTALNLPSDKIVPLSTLVWRLMHRRLNSGFQHPLENARASIDLFRSHIQEWETHIQTGLWPCSLPPAAYAQFFL